MFNGSKDDGKVALRLSGLSAGTYTIYVTGLNTNTVFTNNYDIYVGAVSSTSGNTDYSSFASENLDFYSDQENAKTSDAWVENLNYVAMSVTLGDNEDLVVVSDGVSSGEDRGFLNTVEIAVPAPASLSLLGLGAAVLVARRRRRAF